MTDTDAEVTLRDEPPRDGDGDGFLRRAARARLDSALRFTGGASIDDGQSHTMYRMAETLGASRVFFATWSENCYVGRSLVGSTAEEARAFVLRPLPALPPESTSSGEVVQITEVDELGSRHPWLADVAGSNEVVLAVATWAGQFPTCVIGLAGIGPLDADVRLVIEDFLVMVMGSAIAEILVRQRNRADLRRGEALDTLVNELDGERRRISHEIHDGVLQSVSSIAHFLETLSGSTESETTREVLERLRLEAQNSAITLRRIVNDFEPEQRVEESMTAQVRSLAARVTDLFGLKVSVDIGPGVDDVPLTQPVLRVLRQAIDNIITHADASMVHVAATVNADNELTLTIDDDGKGIENDHPWDLGVGLRSMTRVVNEYGGVLTVGPTGQRKGTRLIATFAINGTTQHQVLGDDESGSTRSALGDRELVAAVRQVTLSLLDRGRRPTISSVAESIGLPRRAILSRYVSADAMVADAIASLVSTLEERWAAFGPIDLAAPLEARLDTLVERRFTMEKWGRPIRLHTAAVDPSSRLDDEVLTAFRSELSLMAPTGRDNTGRLVAWLLRPRTIRAVVGDVSVDPDVARATIRSVAETLLRGDQRAR